MGRRAMEVKPGMPAQPDFMKMPPATIERKGRDRRRIAALIDPSSRR
jgi:hypothetical protein